MEIREEAVNRMLRLLDGFSRKFNCSILLPLLLEHPKFKNSFKHRHPNEYEELDKLCMSAKLNDKQDSAETAVDEAGDDSFSKNESMQLVVYDEHFKNKYRWINILESLSKYEDEMLEVARESEVFLNNYKIIIDHVELLKDIVEYQMKQTPRLLQERKIELRNAEATIAEVSEDIRNLESSYSDETVKYESTVEKLRDEISELDVIIAEEKERHREGYERKISDFKRISQKSTKDTKEDESNLENQLEAHDRFLKELVEAHSDQEKLLREKCIRMEKKRLEARKSYDRDISRLHELKENLEEQLSVTEKHHTNLLNEYNVQTVLHTTLKKEREIAIIKAFAERMDNFEKNRAARIIQRTWRAYHERMASKKKKKTRRNK